MSANKSDYLDDHSALNLLHASQTIREQGEPTKANALLQDVLCYYVKERDALHVAQVLRSFAMAYQHLFMSMGGVLFAQLAEDSARRALQVATGNEARSEIAPARRALGKALEAQGRFDEAVEQLEQMVQGFDDVKREIGAMEAERGDYLCALGVAMCRADRQEEGLVKLREGIGHLERHRDEASGDDPSKPFLLDVWLSGAYLTLAELLREKDPQEAKKHLEEARVIIEGNADLHMRRRQLEQLEETLR